MSHPPGASAPAILETSIQSLPLIHRGKVRDLYAVGDDHLLMIASDRLSAFDVIMPKPLPGKGRLLTAISHFWFDHLGDVVPNHLSDLQLRDVLTDPTEYAQAEGRCMLVKRLRALPVEAVVRGYIIGSGWKDYQATQQICGIDLPAGLRIAEQLPAPIFTPASKAEAGDHDENISFENVVDTIGVDLAERVRDVSHTLYQRASKYARARGIIIADTKFEFGLDDDDNLVLMDEVLTPDSSRFWPADEWQAGVNPPSFDKQYVRDYLETLDWDKTAPGPELPDDVMARALAKYEDIIQRLTQENPAS
ncbi:MAG: phosphoribosylaminoimidazolesuccinocarboxamide synthase [Pseudomonadota bacterium]